ncbi:carboxymuconolactone decarboxylase family protein [Mycobacterium sp.]|uniref:carboxymuconolactone decarboxylase family protein n=1 Tax=Mycobacterium sp. TaxID=1785 RepID=UPI003C78467F
MARIQPSTAFADISTPDLGRGDRINLGVASILGRKPEVAEAIGDLKAAVGSTGTLPPRLMELVRLRVAFHNQCRSCMSVRYQSAVDDGLTEDLVCSLERPAEATDLSAAERSALQFADLFATNHLAIDDAIYDDLRRHFTEDELVELGMHCALCVGLGRLAATWAVTDELPEAFRAPTNPAPWTSEGVIASG